MYLFHRTPPIFANKQLNLHPLRFTLIRSHCVRDVSDDEREGSCKDYPEEHVLFAWIIHLTESCWRPQELVHRSIKESLIKANEIFHLNEISQRFWHGNWFAYISQGKLSSDRKGKIERTMQRKVFFFLNWNGSELNTWTTFQLEGWGVSGQCCQS